MARAWWSGPGRPGLVGRAGPAGASRAGRHGRGDQAGEGSRIARCGAGQPRARRAARPVARRLLAAPLAA